jgi:transcriptional regulator GlxA family with amidase domain
MTDSPLFPPDRPPLTVTLLAFDCCQLLDVTGPLQVFASCNDLLARAGRPPCYAARVCAKGGGAVATSSGLRLLADALPPAEAAPDTLIVVGGGGVGEAAADAALVAWLAAQAAGARRVASVCTGAFLLAATGLLDGRKVATHWDYCELLSARRPQLSVQRDPIFVVDGRIWSSAGITAGIDMALAMVEGDLGREIALAVARWLVVFLKRPGGQAQFSAALALQGDGLFATLHDWIRERLADDLSLPALAARAGMSERSFQRRYRAAMGTTPARAVERLRVEAARRLLSDGDRSIKAVARACGFGSEETMRRSFLRLLEVSPQAYRDRFRSPAVAA